MPGQVLIPREKIAAAVRRIAEEVTADLAGLDPLVIGVMKGAAWFLADLTRELHFPLEIDFIKASSYGESLVSSGDVRLGNLSFDPKGRHVLIVEDILDTGLTLRKVCAELAERGCASVRIAALLRKQKAREADIPARYVGFEIEDVFVVGYGLDARERHRNLPDVHVLEEP
jgi:hypoxanthine phosphoribosyltransferase